MEMGDMIFAYDVNIEEEEDVVAVVITEKDYFERNGAVNDFIRDNLLNDLEDEGFMELMEATFEFHGEKQDAKIALEGLGIVYSDELQDFISGIEVD